MVRVVGAFDTFTVTEGETELRKKVSPEYVALSRRQHARGMGFRRTDSKAGNLKVVRLATPYRRGRCEKKQQGNEAM